MFDAAKAQQYASVINHHTKRAHRATFKGEYLPSEIRAMVLDIVAERYPLWDAKQVPPGTDLGFHLAQAIRNDRYAKGWRLKTDRETGERHWWSPEAVILDAPWLTDFADWTGEPYAVLFGDDDGPAYALAVDWPDFTPGQRRSYARYLEARYPAICEVFEDLHQRSKPPREKWARWEQRQEMSRARLRVEYARELAEARFAVTYGMAVAA